MTKTAELRNLSKQELNEKILALKKSLFEMRSQVSTGRIEKPSKIKETKRDIARILTILREKKVI
ncbi:MAG: 50S ribosomal protein L29 [Candidatus Omnitrophica bacterium]|nr:50S ribosomal protein L29 [Candidatus Omnitrophota bacterium]MBU4457575.1 50S ribosomal protein L29 [Candidatus Omnitrophota bacterium]